MYKNLNPDSLGISGRQSELIELALTYGFRGLDLEMTDLAKRAQEQGIDQANRFLASTDLKIGEFELPTRWQGDEGTYKQDLAQLSNLAAVAAELGAHQCYSSICPVSEELPYHENFEMHRQRLAEIGEVLAGHGIRLGLGLLAAPPHRQGGQYQFIYQAEPLVLLIKTLGAPNIGLALDSWNWHLGGGTLAQVRELGAEGIVLVRLADAPSDADLETITEEQRLLPGEGGLVDSVALLAALAEMDYEGPVTVYPHPSRFSGMTRDAIIQRVKTVLDEQWQEAGVNKAAETVSDT